MQADYREGAEGWRRPRTWEILSASFAPIPELVGVLPPVAIAIPCFNEAARIDLAAVGELLADPRLAVLFVDDGSSDGTGAVLDQACARWPGRAFKLALGENRGKGEAVRRGLLRLLDRGSGSVGYADADFSTPPTEIRRLVDESEASGASVVMGCRVMRLGAEIERRALRHYLGRVYATAAALILQIPVYDTQCGAKVFAPTPALRHALEAPFSARWGFDVELLGRLMAGGAGVPAVGSHEILEVPLRSWRDVPGSKLGGMAALREGFSLAVVATKLARRRAGAGR